MFAPLAIDESRRMLLDAIGPAPEMTLIRPFGNHGDELIWMGTRDLLRGHIYREIGVDQLPSASGELAVISGGGAWSRRYNEFMPETLAIAEQRFERVIVLPSTFEVSEDRVRAALEQTNAIVFARERESYGQIQGICRARLAHDCAFFADLSEYDDPGAGELNAFRLDDERLGTRALPQDNADISESAETLEEWLRTIERHAVVNTDRAHVMIAAARMGKQVNYAPSSYFKVEAIADFALRDFNVQPLEETNAPVEVPDVEADNIRVGVAHADSPMRTTVAVLSRDRPEEVVRAIESIHSESGIANVLVLDRNSRPKTRAALDQAAVRTGVEIRFADRDPGAAANLRLAAELVDSEYVMFLDARMRVAGDTIDQLTAVLDADPDASAVAPAITSEDGTILSCGGWPEIDAATVGFTPSVAGDGGPTGWVPSLGTLFRRSVLEDVPFASGFNLTCQNADWCLRVDQFAPGSLRRSPDATVVAPTEDPRPPGTSLVARAAAARSLPAHANFYKLHDRLLGDRLLELVPELRDRDGSLNLRAARLLMELVSARGPEWTLMEWMNGGLDPLLEWQPVPEEPELNDTQRERFEWLEARNERLVGIEGGGWWRLRERLAPLLKVIKR